MAYEMLITANPEVSENPEDLQPHVIIAGHSHWCDQTHQRDSSEEIITSSSGMGVRTRLMKS